MSGGLDMARGWLLTGQKAKGKEYVEAVWKNAYTVSQLLPLID